MALQEADRLVHDLLIIVHLVAGSTDTGLEDGAGVVIPFQASVWLVPVYAPAKVTRVDITDEPLFITVHLVAHKVHLTRKSGEVALHSQVVSVG